MRTRLVLAAVLALLVALTAGCGGTADSSPKTSSSVANDFSRPEPVLQTVFRAAKTGDTSQLSGLCDPTGKNDSDTRKLCRLRSSGHEFESFKSEFVTGSITNTEIDGTTAEVEFSYGSDGTKRGVMTMVLRKENKGNKEKWYLSSL